MQRNWTQLFLIVAYSAFIGGSVRGDIYFFLFFVRNACKKKKFGPIKDPQEKISDPQNTYDKKFWTHKIPTRKHLRPITYQQKTKTMKCPQEKN